MLTELPISLRQPRDLLPRRARPNPYQSLKRYFLAGYSVASQEQLQHLVSPGRLAFGSAPLPDIHAMGCMRTTTSCQELQTCLQRALVAAPRPGTDVKVALR